MKKILISVLAVCCMTSCNNQTSSSNDNTDSLTSEETVENVISETETPPSENLPDDALIVGKWNDYVAYTVDISESEEGEAPQKELWLEDKSKGYCRKLLTTNPEWVDMDWKESKEYPVTDIMAVDRVVFIEAKDNNVYMIVEGCPDNRNMFVFLMPLSFTPSKARFIPAPSGFVDYDQDNDLLKCYGYGYYEEGGRYETLLTFTMDGKLISSEKIDF